MRTDGSGFGNHGGYDVYMVRDDTAVEGRCQRCVRMYAGGYTSVDTNVSHQELEDGKTQKAYEDSRRPYARYSEYCR